MDALTHEHFMARALQLAERGLYNTDPNPRVGCVLVKNDEIIAEGWHRRAGEVHAEIAALNALGNIAEAKGATAYVTLEPCSHTGKTPPCCDQLIAAEVSCVVAAMRDPNPLVSGQGFERLRSAGIEVFEGVLEAEARALNPGFIKRMETGLPFIWCKQAMSVDGRTAMSSGESQWITGSAARSDVQRLRARCSAIITGSGTVALDNPSFTVREAELGATMSHESPLLQPLRVIVASTFNVALSAKMLSLPGDILVVGAEDNAAKANLKKAGVRTKIIGNKKGAVDLGLLLQLLANKGCNEVLVESGATLSGAFLQAGLIDELVIYMAPKLLGHAARPLFSLPGMEKMADQVNLSIKDTRVIGDDLRINAIVSPPATPE